MKNDDHISVSAWKIKNLDYFQSNLADKNNTHTIMIKNQTYYWDVYIFTDHVWDVTADRNKEMIKNNLHVCLYKTALMLWILCCHDI